MGKPRQGAKYLQLLQLAHVALALGHHVSHLILMFLLLLQPLRLLPLLLLLRELQREDAIVGARLPQAEPLRHIPGTEEQSSEPSPLRLEWRPSLCPYTSRDLTR